MIAKMEFDLNDSEDKDAYMAICKVIDYKMALREIHDYIRTEHKYRDYETLPVETVHNKICSILNDFDIDPWN